MKIKRLEFPLEIKAADEAGSVEGYGSVYGVKDHGGDVVAPKAFAASLGEIEAKGRTIPMLWQHNPGDPVGIWGEFKEDARGLRLKGQILTETTRGRDALAFLRAKAITGLSIGYRTKNDEIDRETGVRTIKEAELWEVSLVTFPMNDEARVLAVKSPDEIAEMSERDIERGLRDAGLSVREAKAVVSRCMALGALRDAAAIRETAFTETHLNRLLRVIKG